MVSWASHSGWSFFLGFPQRVELLQLATRLEVLALLVQKRA
jgi:hypothetical protein